MTFNQNYKKVAEVINIDNLALSDSGDAFKQTYDEVYKVINTQYNSSHLDAILPLVQNLIVMDEAQIEKFYDEVVKHSSATNNREDEFIKLKRHMSIRKNKKEAVLEYIKTGTTTLAFANTLLTIAKTLLGLV